MIWLQEDNVYHLVTKVEFIDTAAAFAKDDPFAHVAILPGQLPHCDVLPGRYSADQYGRPLHR